MLLHRLEQVADEVAFTSTLLEVLPVCSPAIQQQLIGLLPEIVLPQDHEVGASQALHTACVLQLGFTQSSNFRKQQCEASKAQCSHVLWGEVVSDDASVSSP